jgi:hypothetical protein
MATWGEFEAAMPDMAAVGLRQLPGLAYLAIIRRDGRPRLHPVCPFIGGGRLFVTTAPTSPKRLDLVRDRRYALHMMLDDNREEFVIAGRVRLVDDPALRSVAAEAALAAIQPGTDGGIIVRPEEWVFEYDIEHAMTTRWDGPPPHGRAARCFSPER